MALEDSLQNEHDGGREHVAVIVQDVPGIRCLRLRDAQTVLSLLNDAAAARVDRPEVHIRAGEVLLLQQAIHEAAHVLGDVLRKVLGEGTRNTIVINR